MSDDELRALLHGADPAASLPPTDPRRVADLLEDAVSTTRPTPAAPAPSAAAGERPLRRRSRPFVIALAAAAAAVVVAAVAVPVVRALTAPAAPEVTTTLTAAGGADGGLMDCPTVAQVLPMTDTAFQGRAVQVEGDRVVLAVDRVYRGEPGEGVAVVADLQDTGATVGGFPFEVGQEYLVSAVQGTVAVCGGSGPVTPELRAEYERAFG